MENLPANLGKLFLFFVVLLAISDIVLVRWFKIGKSGWKRIEYIWLSFAALGLISVSAEVRTWLAVNKVDAVMVRAEIQFNRLRSYLGGIEPPPYICMKFHRTWLSPDNLDEIQNEYNQICYWNKNLLDKLPTKIINQLPELEYDKYKPSKIPDNEAIRDYLQTIEICFLDYKETRSEYLELKAASQKSGFEELFFYLSPVLLCIALALRITKVTGEIKLGT